MLRTDRKQKYTNDITPFNGYAVVRDGRVFFHVDDIDLDSRLNIKNDVNNDTKDIGYDNLKDDEIVILADEIELTSKYFQVVFKNVVFELEKRQGKDYMSQTIAFAMHNDQLEKSEDNDCWVMHIHRLFKNKSSLMNNKVQPMTTSYQNGMANNVKIEKIEYLPQDAEIIRDLTFREKFLNYMFRTDKQQKWTNENSLFNIYAVKNNNRLHFFKAWEDDSLDKRLEIKKMVMDSIENINFHLLRKNIIKKKKKNKTKWTSDDFEYVFNLTVKKEMPRLLNYAPEYAFKNIAFAMHNDQAGVDDNGWFYMHIHRLYFIDP